MSKYYYFVATLPTLQFAGKPPFSDSVFLELCARFLSPEDLAAVRSATLDGGVAGTPVPSVSPTLNGYRDYERSARNELARLRASRLGRSADRYLRQGPVVPEAETAARAAFAADDPLEAELSLERSRWEFTERLKAFRHFDIEYLVAYRLQLLSLGRREALDPDRGGESYAAAYDSVMKTKGTSMSGVRA